MVWREGVLLGVYHVLLRVLAVVVPEPLEVDVMVSVLDGEEKED